MPSLVFTGRHGTPIDPRTLDRKFTARSDAEGMRRLTIHDARHTCAKLLVDLDVQPHMIMRILRHADQAVTMEICANASSAATPQRCGDLERSWTEPCCTCRSGTACQQLYMLLTR
jgi:hypothetical protein